MDDIWIDLYAYDDTGCDRLLAITGRDPAGGVPARQGPRPAGTLPVRAPAQRGPLQMTFDIY